MKSSARAASSNTKRGRDAGAKGTRSAFNVIVFRCVPPLERSTPDSPLDAPPETQLRHIAVPCVGKLQPEHLLKACEQGADLVLILTCPSGECRYLEGEHRIERRAEFVNGLLREIGFGHDIIRVSPAVRASTDGSFERSDELIEQALADLTPDPQRKDGDDGLD